MCTVILQHIAKASQTGTNGEAEFQQEAEQEVVLSLQTLPGTPRLLTKLNWRQQLGPHTGPNEKHVVLSN